MSERRLIRFDWAMKYMLRNKANFGIIEGFLSALLEDDISIIEILESESNQEFSSDKFNRVDVLVKDSKNRNIIIEIQNAREPDYMYRVIYGVSKHISQSIKIGEPYRKISKVISVSVLYFNLGIGDDYLYHTTTNIEGKNTKEIINKNSEKAKKLSLLKGTNFNKLEIFPEYYFIQIDKFQDELKNAIDEWVYWFKNERVKQGSKSKNIEQVSKNLDMLHMDINERNKYEKYLGNLVSEKNILEGSEEEGRKKGLEEGLEKGREEGENKKSLEIAITSKNMGFDNKLISELTGLSIEEIEKL